MNGNPHSASIPPRLAKAENSTVSSKKMGTQAGQESMGLPPTQMGKFTAEVQERNQMANASPERPEASTNQGRMERGSSMASSRVWTAKGVKASHFTNFLSFRRRLAPRMIALGPSK